VLVALLFFLFAVVELWSPIFDDAVLFPGDLGQLAPITRVEGRSTTPQNALLSDVYVDFGPFLHHDADVDHAGWLPAWNPYNGNGQPYLADAQTMVLSPFTVLVRGFGFRVGLLVAALLRLWLLGFFTYLFLARHRVHDLAAIVGGALFAYAGYHLVWLGYQTHVSVSAFLPVALWLTKVALDHPESIAHDAVRRRIALLALAVAFAAMAFAGHPETLVFDSLLVAGYVVVALAVGRRERATTAARWIARIGAVILLGVGLSAIQLVPFLDYVGNGARPAAIRADADASVAGFSLDTVPMMAFPDLFGGPHLAHTNRAFYARQATQSNYAEVNGNAVGLLGCCLVPVGLVAAWRRRRDALAWFGSGALLVGSLALYTRVAGQLWHHVPLLGSAFLNRSQDVQLLGIAVVAALAVDWVVRDTVRRPDETAADTWTRARRERWGAVSVLLASFTVVTIGMLLLVLHLWREVRSRPHGIAGRAADELSGRHLALEVVLAAVFLLALVAFVAARRASVGRIVAALAVALLAFAANGWVMRTYNPTTSPDLLYPRTPLLRELQAVVGSGLVVFADGSFPAASTGLRFRIRQVGSYDAIGLRWHDDLYRRVFRVAHPYEERVPPCASGLQLFGVRWVVGGSGVLTEDRDRVERTGSFGRVPYRAVPGASFAELVGPSRTAAGDRAALRLVADCAFDPSALVVIGSDSYDPAHDTPVGPRRGEPVTDGSTRVLERGTERVVLRTSSSAPAWLVVRQTWDAGWRASVDDEPASVRRADVAFQAVRVPAGAHTVELRYEPASVHNGTLVSVVSLVVLLGLLGFTAFDHRRTSRGAGTASPQAVRDASSRWTSSSASGGGTAVGSPMTCNLPCAIRCCIALGAAAGASGSRAISSASS
jgi:hypothetical protein